MSRVFLGFMIVLLLGLPQAKSASRLLPQLPTYDIRQIILRLSNGPVARATLGKVVNGRFYIHESYSVSLFGAQDCSSLLNRAQTFSLEGMLKSKYIDAEIYESLRHSEKYLHPDQVTIYNVVSYLTAEEFVKYRHLISDSQLGIAPPRSPQEPDSVAVTVGSGFLAMGYRYDSIGIQITTLPWAKDPVFADVAPGILAEEGGYNYELSRAMQVVPGVSDYNFDAALITIAQEMTVLRGSFEKSRIFFHSYKRANTIAYRRRVPSLKVVATDPNNPENVILSTSLQNLYSDQIPWNYSGVVQDLVAINPKVITISKALNFLIALRGSYRRDLDYIDPNGKIGQSPIVLRTPSPVFEQIIFKYMLQMGIREQEDANQIINLLNTKALMLEEGNSAIMVDPITNDFKLLQQKVAHQVSIVNLDPAESKVDPDYEFRILVGSVLQYQEILRAAQYNKGMGSVNYSVVTSDAGIAKKLIELGPTQKIEFAWQHGWQLSQGQEGSQLRFGTGKAYIFTFTFKDLDRLRLSRPSLFERLTNRNASLLLGYQFRNSILSRPTGL